MVRVAAATLRPQGKDPADYQWWMNDIDEIRVACCVVNAVLFRLGPNVTVSRGNAFHDVSELEHDAQARAGRAIRKQQRRPVLHPHAPGRCTARVTDC